MRSRDAVAGSSTSTGMVVARGSIAQLTWEGGDPGVDLPEVTVEDLHDTVVSIDLTKPMNEIRAELAKYPVKTRVMLSGPMVVARDIAHAKLQERLDKGEGLPDYIKNHPVYYAGPAKTPAGSTTTTS